MLRDLLGLRRDPARVALGLLLSVAGAAGLWWPLTSTTAPPVIAGLGAVLLLRGTSSSAEGLRMSADHEGTPPLYGPSPRQMLVLHTVVPGALTAVALIVLGAIVHPASLAAWGSGLWVVGVSLGAAVTSLLLVVAAALRRPDVTLMSQGAQGVVAATLAMAAPLICAFVLGVQAALVAHGRGGPVFLVVLAGVAWWAASRVAGVGRPTG